jgi:hypothetical protein
VNLSHSVAANRRVGYVACFVPLNQRARQKCTECSMAKFSLPAADFELPVCHQPVFIGLVSGISIAKSRCGV